MGFTDLCALFSHLQVATWDLIGTCERMDVQLREDAITAIAIVNVLRSGLPGVQVIDTYRSEATTGCDLELYVQTKAGWLGHAIQAKKVSLPTREYSRLRHKVRSSGKFQHELLRRHAAANGLAPFYCFYNHWDGVPSAPGLGYSHLMDSKWGISVVPFVVVLKAIQKKKFRNYWWMHSQRESRPWAHLVCDHTYLDSSVDSEPGWPGKASYMREQLPQWIRACLEPTRIQTAIRPSGEPETRPRFVILVGETGVPIEG